MRNRVRRLIIFATLSVLGRGALCAQRIEGFELPERVRSCTGGTSQKGAIEIVSDRKQPLAFPILDANRITSFLSKQQSKPRQQLTIPVDLPQGVDLLCHEDHVIRTVPAPKGKKGMVCVMECIGALPEPFCVSE
jgi:hypothetical protein